METTSLLSLPTSSIALRARAEQERRRRAAEAAGIEELPLLTFRGGAAQAQRTTEREWILGGPAETGKTWAALYRLDSEARRWPNSQWALVRKTRASIDSTVLLTWKKVIALRGGVTPFGGEKPQWYDYPNGARVWLGGMDDPSKVLSGERDGVYVNQAEELSREDWETLTTRTTGRGAVTTTPMLFGDCNPSDPEHWILERAKAGALQLLTSRHEDNPSLHDGTDWTEQGRRTIASLDQLTGPRLARLRHGEWVSGDEDEAFLPSITMWDACQLALPPLGLREPLVLALDAAVSGDTFSVVGVSPWADLSAAVRYVRVWTPNGVALVYAEIERELRELIAGHNVLCLTYDPYQAHYMAQRLSDVIWTDPFTQGADRLEADRQLLDLILHRRIGHDGDTTLRQHLANAARQTDADERRLRIVKRTAEKKIDAAVALSMATARLLKLNV